MLDGWARRQIDPALNRTARQLVRLGATPNAITVASCLIGLAAAAAVAAGNLYVALFLLLVSRIGDGLDGAVARITGSTDFGGFLDIVLDFVFYGAIPLGFVLLDPAANAVAGAVLIFSFYVNGASFLAYAVMAEKRGATTAERGSKSLFFTTGLAEATETILFFAAFCLFPGWFPVLAYAFAAITFYTALSRIVLAASAFRNKA
ncbi:MAG: CDP-alcohol phosphatidyltransferase family protein [Rhizobiaceae bacterium]|nr:CDP-alcohol phosphatidyltransferase family protein [Rhizobiaceae bacterium]